MKLRAILALASATLLSCAFVLVSGAGAPPCPGDADSDTICDTDDNCLGLANTPQTDADSDGYGNVCDFDPNNDCIGTVLDLSATVGALGNPAPDPHDYNADGLVTVLDLSAMVGALGSTPGPSGKSCAVCPSPVGVGAGACP